MGQLQAISLVNADMIPLWIKVSVTLFVCVLVPVYWVQYGPANFLWFSDVALLLTVPTLWLESGLLASMMALAVGLLELAWIVDFVVRLIAGVSVTGLSSYMFDPRISPAIRALSLFHIWLPILLLWMLSRLGYDSRAVAMQTLLSWILLLMSYWLTRPSENVNWVYGFRSQPQTLIPAWLYLILVMVLFPLAVYLPTHFVFRTLFGSENLQ